MSRWRAAAIHLSLSAVIGSLVLALLIFVWYPPPLFLAGGAAQLALTIVGVDVGLGPLLTLTVFKAGKPGLRFDLTVIALLQASAMLYGIHTAFASRPAYLVITPDRATLVYANELYVDREGHDPVVPEAFRKGPLWGFRLVGLRKATDADERSRLFDDILQGKPDLDYRPAYYIPAEPLDDATVTSALSLAVLQQLRPEHAATIERWIAKCRCAPERVAALPLITRKREIVLLLDTAKRRVIEPLDLPAP